MKIQTLCCGTLFSRRGLQENIVVENDAGLLRHLRALSFLSREASLRAVVKRPSSPSSLIPLSSTLRRNGARILSKDFSAGRFIRSRLLVASWTSDVT